MTTYRCMNCDGDIYNQGQPSMSGPGRDYWVHKRTGYNKCNPELGPDSAAAIPAFDNGSYAPGGYVPSGYATWDQVRSELGFTPEEEIFTAKRAQSITEHMNDNRGADQ